MLFLTEGFIRTLYFQRVEETYYTEVNLRKEKDIYRERKNELVLFT